MISQVLQLLSFYNSYETEWGEAFREVKNLLDKLPNAADDIDEFELKKEDLHTSRQFQKTLWKWIISSDTYANGRLSPV